MNHKVLSLIERIESVGGVKVVELTVCCLTHDADSRWKNLDGESVPAGAYLEGRINVLIPMAE